MIALTQTVRLVEHHLKVSLRIIAALRSLRDAVHHNLVVPVVGPLGAVQRHVRAVVGERHRGVLGVGLHKITIRVPKKNRNV